MEKTSFFVYLLSLFFQDNMNGKVLVEKIFRGRNYGVCEMSRVAYKTDYRLIHKHEEAKYLNALKTCPPRQMQILPRTIEMPPLLKVNINLAGLSLLLHLIEHALQYSLFK